MKLAKRQKEGTLNTTATSIFSGLALFGLLSIAVEYTDLLTCNFTAPTNLFLRKSWRPQRPGKASIVKELAESDSWTVWELPETAGSAYVARGAEGSFVCMLVLKGACHVARMHGNLSTGVWFLKSGTNLSGTLTNEDICGLGSRSFPPTFNHMEVRRLDRLQDKFGSLVDSSIVESELQTANAEEEGPSNAASPKKNVTEIPLGVVAPIDAHMGHFMQVIGGLAEINSSINAAVSKRSVWRSPFTLYFVMDKKVSNWTASAARFLFGSSTDVRAAWSQAESLTCFSEVIFPLSRVHSFESADMFRQNAVAAAQQAIETGQIPAPAHGKVSQVTVVQRVGMRNISNLVEVLEAVRAAFPTYPADVISLSNMTVLEQVAAMNRSVLVLQMHGAGMSNVVFQRVGSTVLELFPYKFFYPQYSRIATRFGVGYRGWWNVHRENAEHERDCLRAGGWEDWTDKDCHKYAKCRFCVRNGAITRVHIGELRVLLKDIAETVQRQQGQ